MRRRHWTFALVVVALVGLAQIGWAQEAVRLTIHSVTSETLATGEAVLVITGVGFGETPEVTVDGQPAPVLAGASDTRLTVLAPASLLTTPGTYRLTVVDPVRQQGGAFIVAALPGTTVVAGAPAVGATGTTGGSATTTSLLMGTTVPGVQPNITWYENMTINTTSGWGLKVNAPNDHLILHDAAQFDTDTNWWYLYRSGGDGKLNFYHKGADRLTLDDAGNVGIGTRSPTVKLDVRGHIAIPNNSDLRSTTAIGQPRQLLYADASDYVTIGDTRGWVGVKLFAGAETAAITATSAGRVGIGTSTPAQALSVVGVVESTAGGFKFPDGTTQTTAAVSSLSLFNSSFGYQSLAANTSGSNNSGFGFQSLAANTTGYSNWSCLLPVNNI